jgi:hypothetical protein
MDHDTQIGTHQGLEYPRNQDFTTEYGMNKGKPNQIAMIRKA